MSYTKKMMPKSVQLDAPSLAILIDCWPVPDPGYKKVMQQIHDTCRDDLTIKSIALATYVPDHHDQVYTMEPRWYEQGKDFFYDSVLWNEIASAWNRTNCHAVSGTSPVVRDMVMRDDQVGFTMFDGLQLLYYCNYINPSIRNIYFFGATWPGCIQYRPVGFHNVQNLINHNMFHNEITLLTRTDCVHFSVEGMTPNSAWKEIDKNLFQYCP